MPHSLVDLNLKITTDRLELRHLLPSHAKTVSEIYSSAYAKEPSGREFTEEAALRLLQPGGIFAQVKETFGYGQFLITLRTTGEPIGTVSLMREKYACPDVGYVIHAAHQGNGYATEGAAALVAYAKQHWGVDGVFSFTDTTNERSQRVAKKLGLEYRGTRRLAQFGGQENAVWAEPSMSQDLTVYGIADNE